MTHPRAQYDFGLSALHARTLAVLLIVAAVVTGVSAAGRMWFGDSVSVDETRVAAARECLNPNTASAASLERLPGVGPSRALSIVQYRQAHPAAPFAAVADLKKIRGIGEGTVRKISPYLTLPCGL